MTQLSDVSLPSRVAAEDEGVGFDELGLAARNHGMPLELMRHDVTPLGAHYLLTHYDIPYAEAASWRLEVGGLVRTPLSLSLDDLRRRPTVTRAVTMECAGNGRARLAPRPISQPWLHEAVGTMAWTGTPFGPLLRRGGSPRRGVDVVFTGADHGVETRHRAGLLPVAVRRAGHGRGRAARLGLQRHRPAAAARVPAAAAGARLVRHGVGQVAALGRGRRRALRRLPDARLPAAPAGRGRG